jgi:hypothetical protein
LDGGRRRRCRVTASSARVGIDLAADEARNLLRDAVPVDGPVPVGDEPGGLLRSAEQLLRRVTTPGAGTVLHVLRAQVLTLVWETNTSDGDIVFGGGSDCCSISR